MPVVTPTFAVALTGGQISPEKVTVRTLADILSAVQALVSGRDLPHDDDEGGHAQDQDSLSLLDVKKGSAVFPCLARKPGAIHNLERLGKFLKQPEESEDDRFAFALRPTKVLSSIARQLECSIDIRPSTRSSQRFAVIDGKTYADIAKSLLISGPSTLSGRVQRVGGATEMRCALRVPGREKLLYCDVASSEVSRKLGQELYQDVVVNGSATWFQRSWLLYTFKISDVRTLKRSSLAEAMRAVYEAGGKGWDSVEDAGESIREMR